ncbi:hypothetical protein PHACT_01485 [Pseudohongiella acticola]|uniref:Peptidase M48 domain-containing protein n=1 Tax=Pseudohongiella acticola TaxID=1524254 RepID=A0A1E8CI95_9GAMM|nr:M48 family metallopeptidase [Pseudohongiella acticola]OFE11977.1 hypothetical protein PHACT_01485 [Pseudohongiella acticola]
MDFFQAQDIARRKTGRLVLLFALAVISLIVLTNALVLLTLGLASTEQGDTSSITQVEPALFAVISLAVIAVVGFGSLYKTVSLRHGGARVAESLGGRLLIPGSDDIHEQRILNIVEEMALASSTPVPPVYILDESAINAFAAGYSASDAVIGITRGAITKLQRDQLQGVIAHEFSHILHGDMRLNIRLIGLLHGILVLGVMGYYLMRSAGVSRRGKNGNGIVFLGLGLIVIGAAGTFFGNLIKSAVSRQREYLADASAVQFTRSADGIAGALKQIGSDDAGSQLNNPGAREISHALFSQGVKTSFAALFATHPPLQQRIKRLQPQWDGDFSQTTEHSTQNPASGAGDIGAKQDPAQRQRSDVLLEVAAMAALQRAGSPDSADLAEAVRVLKRLPSVFVEAAHEPHGARALVYFLLLDGTADKTSQADSLPDPGDADAGQRSSQLKFLEANADAGVYPQLIKLIDNSDRLTAGDPLALINIALPALRHLSAAQYTMFEHNMAAVLEGSAGVAPQAWLRHYLVLKHLHPVFQGQLRGARKRSLRHCNDACKTLLSVLAQIGQQDAAALSAFQAAADSLQSEIPELAEESLVPIIKISRADLSGALDQLQQLNLRNKKSMLLAVAACIQSDNAVTPIEQELFQIIAEILDCPAPALF